MSISTKPFLLLMALCYSAVSLSQSVTDTVSIGAGYTNETWYSLNADEQGTAPKNNWDIAFDIGAYGSSIRINSAVGASLWLYPNGDTTAWNTLDTLGLSTWTSQQNSDTSWSLGAFDRNANSANPYDLGWGIYNVVSHNTTGDSIYVIKLSDNSYRKLWIVKMIAVPGSYEFKYANLDGTNPNTVTLLKADYTNRNFGYYSIVNNAAVNREPDHANWDLVFTQYTGFIPQPYTVTGVLSNKGVLVAQADGVGDPTTFADWSSQVYSTEINTIGYDWKTFSAGTYTIADSLVYFVKSKTGDVWKVVFTGFGGGADGNFIFTKENLSSTSTQAMQSKSDDVVLFPNPASGSQITLLYEGGFTSAVVMDLQGRTIKSETLNSAEGFYTHTLMTSDLPSGAYIVTLRGTERNITKKLIVQ